MSIFNRLAKATEADGFLVLGAAETVVGLTDVFKPFPDRRGLYRPSNARATPAKPAAAAFARRPPRWQAPTDDGLRQSTGTRHVQPRL